VVIPTRIATPMPVSQRTLPLDVPTEESTITCYAIAPNGAPRRGVDLNP